ncbi:hypothetical protein EDC01DRAFT_234845 [Geopyxis carbonaria]|nr:hypothetical protein EDC01DRAFT_234845 [Geopyxis carbonaria]
MFPFPSLPKQWEKRLVRYLLHRLDLLEERTLGDLSNLEGSIGTKSVFTVKDVGLKPERLRDLIKIPHRFDLIEAVVGSLTINLPANLFLSGAVEIIVNDVRVVMELPQLPDNVSSTPSTPRPGNSQNPVHDGNDVLEEFPATAEDLAQSFIQSQSKAEQQQLMSLYAEIPMTASTTSNAASTTSTDDDEEEEGLGTTMGLPGVLANLFKGIADRMIVRVRGTKLSLETTLPEDRGGEKVLLQVEVEDVDVEGVYKNVSPPTSANEHEKPRREGKRRIILGNIRGYITGSASMFGLDDPEPDSPLFGAESDITEKHVKTSDDQLRDVAELRDHISAKTSPRLSPKPSPQASALFQPSVPNQSSLQDQYNSDDAEDLTQSVLSDSDKYLDYEDSDEEEVLAFAPPSLRNSARPGFTRTNFQYDSDEDEEEDEDSEDEAEGGASFGHPMPRARSIRSPSQSVMSSSSAMFKSTASGISRRRSPENVEPPKLQRQPSNFADDSSGDEMDVEASRMLSQSTIFSREEADSLYMSATSGMLRSRSEIELHHEQDEKDADDEEIDAEEMDERLDKLINGETVPQSPKSPENKSTGAPQPRTSRKIRKECLYLDTVTIYYPSLSAGAVVAVEKSEPAYTYSYQEENRGPQHMPGAFSMYASRHSGRLPTPQSPPAQHRSPHRVKIVDALDARPSAPSLDNILGEHASGKHADIEIIASNIRGTVDIQTEKMLGWVLETVQDAMAEEAPDSPRKKKKAPTEEPGRKKTIQLIAEEIDVKLIHHLRGNYIDNEEVDEGDDRIQLQCQLNDVKILRKGLPDNASTSKLSVKKFALRDEEEGIITFLPARHASMPGSSVSAAKMSHSAHHRKRSSTGSSPGGLLGHGAGDEDDIVVIFSQSARKVRVNVQTLPLRIRGDLKRLEETFSAFGGVGGVLASTTASTATITKAGKPPSLPESEILNAVDTKVDARIGGLVFDVVGETATVNMETSPLKIKFQSGGGVSVNIDKIEVSGPTQEKKDARLVIDGCKIEFASKPTQEDLGRLLELLTPSKDRYDDDDILIDTLLRQREQGSVLRMFIAGVRGELIDMTIFDRLKELGDEVIKVLTVTDFVAGDERPGLLTLIAIEGVYGWANVGGGLGRVETEMDNVGMMHVSAPSLFAVAVGTTSVRRDGIKEEDQVELLGEGLARQMFSTADHERPMIMVRMIGDEPEPVIKIKLWNIRVEYSVETLMKLMQAPDGATGEELAQEMVQSIIALPPKEQVGEITALGFDIVIKDSVVALNPLNLKSRGLVIFTDAQLQAALPTGGNIRAGMDINKASIMLIDNVDNLLPPERGQMRGRREILSEHLTGFASQGYVPVITISSANVTLQVAGKAVEVDIKDDLLLIESCADSTQTLIAILNGLSPPPKEDTGIKYLTECMPIDVFRSMTEDEFAPSNRSRPDPIDDEEEELLYHNEDVPTNFTFVDSFYGHKSPPETPAEDLADSMLEEDLAQINSPASLSRQGSGRDSVFREQVNMLDSGSLVLVEDHFQLIEGVRSGKRALNQDAVDRTPSFPFKIRVRDVDVIWNLHDGYDWQQTRDTINNAVRKVESKAAERRNRRVSFDIDDDDESVVDDFLFNSIYIGISTNRDPKDLSNVINKNFDDHMSETSYATSTAESSRPLSSRSRSTVTDYHHHSHRDSRGGGRKGLKLNRSRQHKLQIEIKGVNIDMLMFPPDSGETQASIEVRCNNLEIFDNVPTSTWRKFVTYNLDEGERESKSDMIRLEIMVVKPVAHLSATELVVKVNVLPLRLHVDQDTLDFLTRFFEFKDDSVNLPPPDAPQPEPPFFQSVEVQAVKLCLDYKPKKVDYAGLRSGHTTEFMNFFILDEAKMVLRRVVHRGVSGMPRLHKLLNDTWMPDIRSTQLGDVLSGVAPVRSLVNLTKNTRDLIYVPMREYKKDGRIVRSVQKGVGGFVRNTTGELVRLGAKMAVGTQAWLQSAEDAFAGPPPVDLLSDDEHEDRVVSRYADQPETVRQGVAAAGRSIRRNFGEARDAFMGIPAEMAERGDARGAVAAVARAAPVAVIRPMLGVSEAVGQTLMGVGNAMEPERRRRREDKYKSGH